MNQYAGTKSSRRKLRLASLMTGAALLLGGAGAAYASQPTAASGTFAVTAITSLELRPAGQITVLEQTTTGVFAGTLSGTFEDALKAIVNPTANKVVQGFGKGTCVCTVAGRSGTLDYVLTSSGPFDAASFEGRLVIKRGTSDLAGLHGLLEVDGTVDPNGLATVSYSGTIHFDP